MKKQSEYNKLLKDKPLSSLILLKKNSRVFLILLLFIVVPIIILSSITFEYFYTSTLSFLFSLTIYTIIFLFIISFITLNKISNQELIPFDKILKLIPSILPKTILPILVFALAITIPKQFYITLLILFVIFPTISFISFFNSKISLSGIIKTNFEFNKTENGKNLRKNIFIISIILFFVLGIIIGVSRGVFAFLYGNIYYITISVFTRTLNILGLIILYLTAAKTYADYVFLIPENILNTANDILTNRRTTKQKRTTKHKRQSFVSETKYPHKKTSSSFGKEKPKKERNRFADNDDSFNRFEDTKF